MGRGRVNYRPTNSQSSLKEQCNRPSPLAAEERRLRRNRVQQAQRAANPERTRLQQIDSAKQRRDKRALDRGSEPSDGEDAARDHRPRVIPETEEEEKERKRGYSAKGYAKRKERDDFSEKQRGYNQTAAKKVAAASPRTKARAREKNKLRMRRLRARWGGRTKAAGAARRARKAANDSDSDQSPDSDS